MNSIEFGITIIVILSIFSLGFIAYIKNPKSRANLFLALTLFMGAVWAISNTLENQYLDFQKAKLFLQIDFMVAPFIAYFWIIFCLAFPKSQDLFTKKIAVMLLVFPSLFTISVPAGLVISDIKIVNKTIHFSPGILFPYYALFFVLYTVIVGCALLILKYKKSKGIEKNQIFYIFSGLFISGLIAVLVNLILPNITTMSASINSAGVYGFLFFTVFATYAIVKHRLMDIRLLVLRSVAYAVSLGIIAGGYVSLTVFVFQRLEGAINTTFLNIGTLFILVLTFQPLKRFIEQHTDRLFSKGRYKFRELLGKINDISNKNSRSISAVTIKVMKALTEDMRINKAAIAIISNTKISEVKALGYKSKSKSLWAKPVKIAAASEGMVVYDELEEDSEEKDILRKADVEVLIPILSEEEARSIKEEEIEVEKKGVVQAVLALGPKKSGVMYTSEDLKLLELAAPQLALAFENAKSFKEKEQRITELKSINKMFQHIEQFIDLDKLLEQIVSEAITVTGAEGGSLMLLNKAGKTLSIRTAKNLHPLISLNAKIKIGEGIAGHVAQTHEPIILNGLRDKRFRDHLKRYEIFSAISVPLITGYKLVGVLNVNRKKIRNEFSEENLNVMMAFAAQAAEAIEKAGYFSRIKKLSVKNDNQFKEFTKALARTVDAKDPYTYGHSEAVTNYTLQIAKEMGFNDEKLRLLEIGGRLHDMGKIGVAEHILNKPGGLTDEEFKEIQRHPEIGARILQDTSSLKGIRDLILYHHERYDGNGYPTGLKGKDIPLGARIMAIADTFDAMTSHRAYRKALSRKIAITEIKKNSGTQFDPEVVQAFLKVLEKKRFRLIKNTRHQAPYRQKPNMMEVEEK